MQINISFSQELSAFYVYIQATLITTTDNFVFLFLSSAFSARIQSIREISSRLTLFNSILICHLHLC